MTVFYQLTKNTFRECLRDPVYFLTLYSSLLIIGVLPYSSMLFNFREQMTMALESSLALIWLAGIFIVVLCASGSVRREMTYGTVLALLSKPVSRSVYVFAKICGNALALTVFMFVTSAAMVTAGVLSSNTLLLDEKGMGLFFIVLFLPILYGGACNYFARRSFPANAILALLILVPLFTVIYYFYIKNEITKGGEDAIGSCAFIEFTRLFPAIFLVFLSLLLMSVFATVFSIRHSFFANGMTCLSIFVLGTISGPCLNTLFDGASLLKSVLGVIIPNWQNFWVIPCLRHEDMYIPAQYLWFGVTYTLIYAILIVVWGIVSFQEMEPAKDAK